MKAGTTSKSKYYKNKITASDIDDNKLPNKNNSIIGQYEGECADASITNENGMDITSEVFETVFNSDDYKKAIELGWYIGFLGHPEQPDCMDFEHSCIVMTEGHIEPDGKVYGKFNLVNTPVGRIVASLQDAGVKFGISIRGVGDLVGNSVDPDTFVFRGFDLVTFPAFPDAIPEFTKIAASTDLEKRKKYQKACTTLKDNLQSITSSTAIDVLKDQFAEQSDEYKMLEARQNEILGEDSTTNDGDDNDAEVFANSRINGIMNLYLKACSEVESLTDKLEAYRGEIPQIKLDASRKLKSMQRILGSQINDVLKSNDSLTNENNGLRKQITAARKSNLIYKQKIDEQDSTISEQQQIISSLRTERSETITASTQAKARTSDLDAQNKKLKSQIQAAQELISQYQDAYANLYASLTGASLDSVTVTASTNVDELKQQINGCKVKNKYTNNAYQHNVTASIDIVGDVTSDDNELITL